MFAKLRQARLCQLKFGVILATALVGALLVRPTAAGVSLTGSRIVFQANQGDKTLQFQNSGEVPNMVDIRISAQEEPDAEADEAQSTFVVMPQIFRIDSNKGQIVRLILTDASSLPTDRESVFYLRFSQLPAQRVSTQNENQIIFMLTSRVKLFYRPAGLPGSGGNTGDKLRVSWVDGGLRVENPTPFYVSSIGTSLTQGDQVQEVRQVEMIAPYSTVVWPAQRLGSSNAVFRIAVMNDYGASAEFEHILP